MNHIEIFTDGACRGNPGKGGWGAVIRSNGKEESIYGSKKDSTNNSKRFFKNPSSTADLIIKTFTGI